MKSHRNLLSLALLALFAIVTVAFAQSVTTIPSGNTVIKLYSGSKTVAAAATPETLTAGNAYVVSVLIEPATTTQGPCYIGAKGLENVQLPVSIPGYNLQGSVLNLKDIYVKVATNGDKVNFIALYR